MQIVHRSLRLKWNETTFSFKIIIIVGRTVTKNKTGPRQKLIFFTLVYNGDMRADWNGARLSCVFELPISLYIPSEILCQVAGNLHSDSIIYCMY